MTPNRTQASRERHSAIFSIVPVLALVATFSLASKAAGGESIIRTGCQGCEVTSENYDGARLFAADLSDSTLTDVSFIQANLFLARFDRAKLTGVSFRGADLKGATFDFAVMTDVSFTDANLTGARFDSADVSLDALRKGHLCNTTLPGLVVNNSDCDTRAKRREVTQ